MNWRWWRKEGPPEPTPPPPRDTEVQRAKERALLAQREAEHDLRATTQNLKVTTGFTDWSQSQRRTNHFGPTIYDAMRPK